jgi:hypothetical protein
MNTTNNRPTPPMPKITPMPVPTQGRPQPKPSAAEIYDPEVLRIVQADVDRKRKIAELESDRDDWRRQALDAKQEVKRLEMVLARDHKEFEELLRKERAENDEAVERLGHERDVFKGEVVRIKTCAQNGAAVFLQILDDGLSVTRAEQVGQQAVAEEIDREQAKPGGKDFPRVVTAGPREAES